jgi:hypothetical protein
LNHRDSLNLIVVLDISGSMGSPFHDQQVTNEETKPTISKKKMEIGNFLSLIILKLLKF